jgi:hypothetical protein
MVAARSLCRAPTSATFVLLMTVLFAPSSFSDANAEWLNRTLILGAAIVIAGGMLAIFWRDLRFWLPSFDHDKPSILWLPLVLVSTGVAATVLATLICLAAPREAFSGERAVGAVLLSWCVGGFSAGPATAAIWWRRYRVKA